MFFDDHPWPHVHVRNAEYRAVIAIDGFEVRGGYLPPRVLRLVRQWCQVRQEELRENWQRAETHHRLKKVAPLS